MTIIEYEAKIIELARYAHFLVINEREKVRRCVDRLEHNYHRSVVQSVRDVTFLR